jgi:hypothetical protein
MATLRFDDARLNKVLEAELKAYPVGNHCEVLAQAISKLLYVAGYEVAIVTFKNEVMPGTERRPPFILANNVDGSQLRLAETGFHDTVQIIIQDQKYYIDGLVFLHHGTVAISEDGYFELLVYPNALEVTDVRRVE